MPSFILSFFHSSCACLSFLSFHLMLFHFMSVRPFRPSVSQCVIHDRSSIIFIHSLCRSCFLISSMHYSVVQSFHYFILSYVQSFHYFILSYIHSFIHSLSHSFFLSFIHPVVNSFIRSFIIPSLIESCFQTFTNSRIGIHTYIFT